MWLVIDCTVLVDASGQGVSEYAESSLALLKLLLATPEFVLALDAKRKIQREYENRVRAPMYAHQWLDLLQRKERVKPVERLRIPKGASVSLREARLHKKDFPLVEAALGSSKVIVTRDPSFSEPVKSILHRELDITVLDARQAVDQLSR